MKKLVLTVLASFCLGLLVVGAGQAADGQALYAKCAGCHGADGGKAALGVGKPLKGLSAAEVAQALREYKAKTKAGEKKAIMEAQAARLSEDDIQALAETISKF